MDQESKFLNEGDIEKIRRIPGNKRITILQVACFSCGLNPAWVITDAIDAINQHGGPLSQLVKEDLDGAFHVMYGSPEMFFIPPVGRLISELKRATSPLLGFGVTKKRAIELLNGLGYKAPHFLTNRKVGKDNPRLSTRAVIRRNNHGAGAGAGAGGGGGAA